MKNSEITLTLPSKSSEEPPRMLNSDEDPPQILDSTKGGSAAAEESFPIPEWERYQGVDFLGKGGMGRVFLAYEPLLRRHVALKFVRRGDPELVRRLLDEARAQARVKHDRVCEVYEVGEVQGQPYIAMQFIDGQSLGEISASLMLKEKVRVLRDAAEGVQAAHRENLIHRDIKPSNILVERTQDGRLKPYIMDFGLARDWRERSSTVTGAVIGTPQYMSPEQARGEVTDLDRRSDVYSLGATLYELLTGVPPITGRNPLEVLGRVLTQEPLSPRRLNPAISRDLEAIVLKCLEKERSARYESVTALIQDLDRFLADEPIPSLGVWYWLGKKVRKHRVLVSVATAGIVAVTLALGWASYARAQTVHLLGSFTEKVKNIEHLALASALTKPHDTREDRKRMLDHINDLDAEISEAGDLAFGPGKFALARGYLALGELDTARTHLEAAWGSGFRDPRVAYTLALVLGRLYQHELQKAEGLSREQAEARKQQLKSEFVPPILAYLKESQSKSEEQFQTGSDLEISREYVEALIAFYEEHFDEALEKLPARRDALSWAYEPFQLEGDIHRARAIQLWNRGDAIRAQAGFEASRKAYANALEIGRSVPALYLALGELELAELIMKLYNGGDIDTGLSFERGLEAANGALVVAPDQPGIFLLKAGLYRRYAEDRLNGGTKQEPKELLQPALEAAKSALDLGLSPQAHLELGQCYTLWGQSLQRRGKDPSQQLREAAWHFEEARSLGPQDRYSVLNALGVVYATWAKHVAAQREDPGPLLDKAIGAFREATRLNEKLFNAWRNLAETHYWRAQYRFTAAPAGASGSASEQDLESAREAASKARSIDSGRVTLYYTEGLIHEMKARMLRARGGNSQEAWTQAIAAYREGLSLPGFEKLPYLLHQEGAALQELAQDTWDQGGNPLPFLDEARAAFESAGDDVTVRYNLISERLQRAKLLSAQGESPEAILRKAIADAMQDGKPPEDSSLRTLLGAAYTLLAEFELEQGGSARQSLDLANEALRGADPQDAQTPLYRGVLHGLRVRARLDSGKAEDFQQARNDFQHAIQLSLGALEYRIALGRFCQEWAARAIKTGQDHRLPLEKGLEQAKLVLKARANWADALVLDSSLSMLEAESASSPEEKTQQRDKALKELNRALELNPHLTRRWEPQRLRLEQLSHTLH